MHFFFRTLRILSLEGNEIEYMPSCMLQMTNLQQLNVKNNYLHPLIWRKLLVNSAQVRIINIFYLMALDSNFFIFVRVCLHLVQFVSRNYMTKSQSNTMN